MNKPLPKLTSDLHRVGGGYSVQFSTRAGTLQCEWTPSMPSPRDLRRKVDLKKYEAARDSFCADLARLVAPEDKEPMSLILELEGGQ